MTVTIAVSTLLLLAVTVVMSIVGVRLSDSPAFRSRPVRLFLAVFSAWFVSLSSWALITTVLFALQISGSPDQVTVMALACEGLALSAALLFGVIVSGATYARNLPYR